MAMVYHGIILFKLQMIKKVNDAEIASNENGANLSNSIIKWDRLMLIGYIILFVIFNGCYFIKYVNSSEEVCHGVNNWNKCE